MAFTSKDDINILQPSDSAVVGAGTGNDVYILALDRLSAGQQVQISDAQGNNSLQLIGGLTISSSIVAANAVQLTLSNGAVVTVLGADSFSYEIGGNPLTKTAGTVQNYTAFATSTLGVSSVPTSGTVQGTKNVTVSSTVTGTGSSVLQLQLMDTHSLAAGTGPLKDNPYNGFRFAVNGKMVTVSSSAIDNALTYAELKTAIETAVKAVPELANFTVSLGSQFTVFDTLGTTLQGTTITLTSTKGEVVTTPTGSGWVAPGAVLPNSGLHTNMSTVIGDTGTSTSTGTGTSTNFHTSVTGVDSASLLTTQSSIVKALNGGEKWSSTSLTYSFDTTRPADYTGVQVNSAANGNLTTGWQPLSATLSTLSSEILSSIDKLVQLSFTQVSANGDIRFSQLPTSGSVAAFAYFPGTTPSYSGDVFIDTGIDSTTLGAGGYGQLTITHELGHALGLKHPFKDGVTLPTADDNHVNTVMSYTDYQNLVPVFTTSGSSANVIYQQIYPDRFMVYDIAALQAIYGADSTTQTGNNTYQYGTSPFYASIWDAGGTDTLDLSTTTASDTVDLTPGRYSSINTRSVSTQAQEQKQTFASQGKTGFDSWIDSVYSQQPSTIYTGTHNLGIAYGAIIENVITGSAADTVTDNKVDNDIKTSAGNDLIYLGAGGHDTIDGGAGTDSVSLALTKSQVTYTSEAGGLIRLVGTTFAADLYNVEKLVFTDQTVTLA